MIIEIPGTPPSLNKFIGRKNVHAYRSAKREWDNTVYLLAIRRRPKKPYQTASVHIHCIFPDKRRRDIGNIEKFITDGLVMAGIIQDDSYDHIELILTGEYKAGDRRTIVEVVER